jgi:predicted nucleic acid-binding protein
VIILDTNVISELIRPEPEPAIRTWLRSLAAADQWLTAVTVAELSYGVARLPEGRRRDDLAHRVDRLLDQLFAERILPFDEAAARRYGDVVAVRDSLGRPVGRADAQIAAMALHREATLATRNTRDFEGLGLTLIDPWTA